MVLSVKNFASQKCRGEGVLAKKRRFFAIFRDRPKKFSNGCQSDNFDPRTFAYGSSESLCPKFSETHAEKVSIFKIVGARPLRSQVTANLTLHMIFLGI